MENKKYLELKNKKMAYQNHEIQLSGKFTALIPILEKKTESH